jgi:trk system potassium uptake protein TrkH
MPTTVGSVTRYPARVSCFWYAVLILVGAAGLMHPWCRGHGAQPWTAVDALFTSTSACCVTGLSVRSTGNDLSFIGQIWLLLLIQLGGVGIMTVTTYVLFSFGSAESMRARRVISETLGADETTPLRKVLREVLLFTLITELAGSAILFLRLSMIYPPGEALWWAAFHSVSAFCNAGFGLFDDNLTRFQDDPIVIGTIGSLIILGGIGYPVVMDIRKRRKRIGKDFWRSLHLHSKVMLIGTAGFLVLGIVVTILFELHGTFRGLSPWQMLVRATFHSISTRTAGFNSIAVGDLSDATLFFTIVLMGVGGGPCSTAGGFKVSNVMLLIFRAWSSFRGFAEINVFRRTVPEDAVDRATTTLVLFFVIGSLGTLVLLVFESDVDPSGRRPFLPLVFEAVSALGTVGLSMGVTPFLSSYGKLTLVALMFLGRLGPISVFAALARSDRDQIVSYPREEPLTG